MLTKYLLATFYEAEHPEGESRYHKITIIVPQMVYSKPPPNSKP